MQFIDTHAHLFANDFNHDRGEVVERAQRVGVKAVVLPNIDSNSIDTLLSTSLENENLFFPCMGLHPTSVKENFWDELKTIETYLNKGSFYGVGEIGIDLYWDKSFIEQQKEAFRYQLQLAKKHQLPVIIHSRNSFDEILEIVDHENDSNLKGVFHSFSGTIDHYRHISQYGGFLIGIGGVVTYKHGGVDKIVTQMDLNHIVLETDSPYLSPIPHRGKRNESANLIHIAQKVAEIKNITIDKVASVTTSNACKLFSLKMP